MEYPVAFTQTCPNSNLSYLEQFKLYWPELKSALDLIGNYEVYPELTLNGVLHFHGKLKVNCEEQYYRQKLRLRKKLGFNLFKMIDNVPKWDKYITKKVVLMKKIYPKEELPLTDTIKLPTSTDSKPVTVDQYLEEVARRNGGNNTIK